MNLDPPYSALMDLIPWSHLDPTLLAGMKTGLTSRGLAGLMEADRLSTTSWSGLTDRTAHTCLTAW